MARILYGVHGIGHGHAVRALTIARHFAGHEFLFVSHDTGAAILGREFPVEECPNPPTIVKGHRVDVPATLIAALKVRSQSRRHLRRVLDVMDRFQPEVAMTDYEYFVPQAARRLGVPCLSIDHQHVITMSRHPVPWSQFLSYLSTRQAVASLYSQATDYLVISFFQTPVKPGARARILPPLLRESVLGSQPRPGDHVVAYQGYATFKRFFPFLMAIPSPVRVYGFDQERSEGNLHFKKNSEDGFLDDLSSCRYVVMGGSHTLVSEALYYGKPVISFPIKTAFEQFLNAFYVERLGYGRYFTGFRPRPKILPAFEAGLKGYRDHIQTGNFCGNQEIFDLVDQFIREKKLDY
jgi:uncharacterized protein (TIGR00661 family)